MAFESEMILQCESKITINLADENAPRKSSVIESMKLIIALAITLMVVSGANAQGLSGTNSWTGQNYTPPCPLTLSSGLLSPSATSCAAGASYGVHTQTATLTTSAILKFPTGLKDGSFITFRIAQDATGGRSLALNGGGPISINTSPGTVSVFTCYGYGGASPNFTSTQVECGPVSTGLNVGNANVPYAIVSHAVNSNCADGTSCAGPSLSKTSGNKLLVFNTFCGGSFCPGNPTQTVSSITGTGIGGCVLLKRGDVTLGQELEAWLCNVTATGTNPITVNYSGAVNFPQIQQVVISGVASSPNDGITGAAAGQSLSPSVTTAGPTTQATELVIAYVSSPLTADVYSADPTYTVITDSVTPAPSWAQILEWKTSGPTGQAQTVNSTLNQNDNWSAMIVVLKHP